MSLRRPIFLPVVTALRAFAPLRLARRVLAACAVAFTLACPAFAAPVINAPATSFTAAQSGRTFMTVGGVWNGTTEVTATTGDTFTVTYTNTGDATAFDFVPLITLPSNFTYVAATATVSTSPATPGLTVSGSQAGTTLTLALSPTGYDLPAGSSITFTYGLTTTSAIASGTYQITYNRNYSLTNGGALVGTGTDAQQNILVQAGDTTINITPTQQLRAVGDNASFTITVTNTGLGGIFDVTLDDSAIQPSGNNLQFVSLTKTAPSRSVTSANGGSKITLGYLAPGEVFTADVVATVLSCGSILNPVSSVHRANAVPVTGSAPVQLDFLQPLVDFTPAAVALDYNVSVPVSVTVNNTGLGAARTFRLQSNVNSLALTVSNVAAGWTYTPATGLFTYTANSGVIANGGSATLTYNVLATDPCTSTGAGTITYTALYDNGCGDPYTIPIRTQSVTAPTNLPTLTLQKTVSSSRIAVLEAGSYTLTLSATNIVNIGTTNVTVTDVLPASVDYVSHATGPSAGSASYTAGTRTVTWTVPVANLTAARTLTINFAVGSDPCNAGTQPNNTANTSSVTTSRGCSLNASASASFLISNNPGLSASQFFDVTSTPANTAHETGNADAAPLGTRGTGEGEFIAFQAGYTFGALYPGTWAGSTYTDGFGGVTQMVLSSGSLTVTGSFGTVAVPTGSITTLSPGFRIDLGFLAGASFFNNANVAGRSITLNYRTTAPDTAAPSGTRSVTQLADFVLAGGGGGAGICASGGQNRFTQGAFYSIGRAQAQVGLSLPSVLEVCKDENLVITISNGTTLQARNLLVTLLNSGTHYTVDTGVAPVYGGTFNSGNITYTANGGVNPTFQFTGNPLTGNGTIQLRVRRIANGNTTPGALTARVDYDTWQTAAAGSRVYNSTGSYTPSSVRKANLTLTVTPGSLTVTSPTVTYVTYVANTDAGTAVGTVLTNTLPVGITVNATATNAANASLPGGPYTVSTSAGPGGRQTLTWALGNLASGTTVPITLVADVGIIPGCAITIVPANDRIQATWGCDSNIFATVTRTSPNYTFPAGKMQVVHDSTQTVARLCDPGKVVVVVKNTGSTNILGVTVQDVIPPSAGLSINGTVQYRINNGALINASAPPTGTGASGTPYTWTSTQIPELASLVPVGVSGTNQINIEITLAATEALASQNPVLSASGSATISCGNAVTSPAQPFTIPIERPEVTIAKSGRNITANPSAAFTGTVYGGQGDFVEWRMIVTNNGAATANNLRLSDVLSGSGGTAVLNGPGHVNTAFTPGLIVTIPSLAPGGSATYIITETLGGTCVTGSRDASVSWGCVSNGANAASNVTTPGTPTSPATIVMLPSITGGAQLTQSITSLPGGRAQVTVTITNNGGTAYNPVITATLPAGSSHDTTGTVSFGGTVVDITGVSRTGGTDSAPVFTFSGPGSPHLLRFGESISVTYFVRPTVFDTTTATTFPALVAAEPAPSLDPTVPSTANITADLAFTTSCGAPQSSSNSISYDPLTPDLDVIAFPANAVLDTTSAAANYDFQIRNDGDQGSVANFITITVRVGKAWSFSGNPEITSPAGTAISGMAAPVIDSAPAEYTDYTYTLPTSFSLTRPTPTGNSPVIRVRLPSATVLNNGRSLVYQVDARGESRAQDGTTVTGNYSLDRARARLVGVSLTKTLQSTSETESTTNNVLLGEQVTYRINATFFGADSDITSITLNDTPADSNTSAHNGLAYVSHAFTGSNEIVPDNVTVNGAAPSPVAVPTTLAQSRIAFTRATLNAATLAAGTNTLEADVTVRVLNIAANTDAKSLRNNLGLGFTYLGQVFRSSDADDGLAGGTATAVLHKDTDVVVRRPSVTIAKTVRNVTRSGTFAATAPGEAGDVVEYRIIVTNTASNSPAGQRPLYNLTVTDTVPAKLNLSSADQGADTNGSPASIEVANTGGSSGLGATITFTQANTAIATAGQNFTRLDPGQTITLLYRGTLAGTVIPSESLPNTAATFGYSVPVDGSFQAVNQTAPKGTSAVNNPGTSATAATRYDAAATAATVAIDAITQQKVLNATSAPGSADPLVFIGEQLRYRVALVLPQGSVPDLVVNDSLPDGLSLVSTPVITFGAGISPSTQPTITPAVLPANGAPLAIAWNFGARTVTGATVADRTVTIDYVAQVRNVTANINPTSGVALVNSASYSYTGAPIVLNQVTVNVASPNVTTTHGVRNITRNPAGAFVTSVAATDLDAPDAGDVLEYQITLANASGGFVAPAYDIALADTVPTGFTFVAGSATVTTATGVTGAAVNDVLVPDIAGQLLTWGRTQTVPLNLDIAPGGTLTLRYRVTVNDTGRPLQLYTNSVVADWTSLDGAPGANLADGPVIAAPGNTLGERIGSGAASPNNLRAIPNAPVTARNSPAATKTASGATLPLSGPTNSYRIGDLVTYTVTLTVNEGTHNTLTLTDQLPAGLVFVNTVSILPATGTAPWTYTTPAAPATAPAAGATGTLTWTFGTVLNTGDNNTANDTLTVIYTARIVDAGGIAVPPNAASTNAPRLNSAVLAYERASPDGTYTHPAQVATIQVDQPFLTLAKARISPAAYGIARPSAPVTFELTVANTGTAPAYNVVLRDVLPDGMRDATPVINTLTLNGASISATTNPPAYNATTGEYLFSLTDAQFIFPAVSSPILPGQSLVLRYTVTLDADAPKGQTLINSATVPAFYSKPDTDLVERRQYAALGPVTQSIIVGLEISGTVYNDIEPNSQKDGFEDWTAGTPVFVNLVDTGTNTVLRTAAVPAGTGDYVLPDVPPGNYRIIVTNTAVAIAASAPSPWLFRGPATGERPVAVTITDYRNQDFGLYKGRPVSGVVFRDTGTGGATANDGRKTGGELGIPGVTVRLLTAALVELDRVETTADGTFVLYVPDTVANGAGLIVEEINPAGHLSTGGFRGTPASGTYTRSTDRLAYNHSNTTARTGIEFGDVPENALLTDGAQTVLPGATALYRHTFTAGTGGTVAFTLPVTLTPAGVPWTQILVRDVNCNGAIDATELPLTSAAITVTAGQEICLLVKVTAPPNVGLGAQHLATLTADFVYTNASPALTGAYTRVDLTTTGTATSSSLQLRKAVDKTTASPGEVLTYTITYLNAGAEPLANLFIDDRTPAYTVFVSASNGAFPNDLTGVTITQPAVNATGTLRWTFTGTLAPGGTGTVTFQVKVQQ